MSARLPDRPAPGPVAATAADEHTARLDELAQLPVAPAAAPAASAVPTVPAGGCLLGEVVDAVHPTLVGRVLVRWDGPAGSSERWIPTIHRLAVRAGDRVLLMQPANHDEPVVAGVLDGFARRPELAQTTVARVTLQSDEAVRIEGVDGQPLVELLQGEAGPVVRLLQPDVEVELPGALRLSATQIELKAREGAVEIRAAEDVNVRGEVVNLN